MDVYEKIKKVREESKKNYLYISPYSIEGGAKLVVDSDTLDLYEKMGENTIDFAEKEIEDLITKARTKKEELSKVLELNLVLCENIDNLPKGMSNVDIIKSNVKKIVAIVKHDIPKTTRADFYHTNESNNNFTYLDLEVLLGFLKENNIKFDIISELYPNDKRTGLKISYYPKKEIEADGYKNMSSEEKNKYFSLRHQHINENTKTPASEDLHKGIKVYVKK